MHFWEVIVASELLLAAWFLYCVIRTTRADERSIRLVNRRIDELKAEKQTEIKKERDFGGMW